MNTLHIFYALLWAVLILGALAIGGYITVRYATAADANDTPALQAIGGTILRVVITLLIAAVIIGLPFDLTNF